MLKNKIYYALLILVNLISAQQLQAFKYLDVEKMYDSYIEKAFGNQDVTSQTENYIRELAQKIGIKREFKIKRIDHSMLAKGFAENAFAHNHHLYVHEPFLNVLSPQEREFIICHELSHLFHKHAQIRSLYNTGYFASLILSTGILFKSKADKNTLILGLCGIGCYVSLGKLLSNKLMHFHEFQADEKAVKTIGNADGAVAFFKRLAKLNNQAEFNDSANHPSLNSRINAVKLINNKG